MRPKLIHLKKIKVGAVSYLNTKPLLYGINHHPVSKEIELIEDYPSNIAQLLIENKIDLGLVPVAVIPKLNEHHIITDFCIGADGPVASVGIFSEVPMEAIEKVYLDYQSETSVNLAKILLKKYWKKDVILTDAKGEDFRKEIKGSTAGVIIGDRALEQRTISKYIFDLGEAWKNYTGLPFVFAAWVANKDLNSNFVEAFNEANAHGLKHLNEVIEETTSLYFNLAEYYNHYVSYDLNEEKRKGMQLFLERLTTMNTQKTTN